MTVDKAREEAKGDLSSETFHILGSHSLLMLLLELWEREKKSCSFSKVYSMRHVLNVLLFYLGYLIKVIWEKHFQGVGNIIHSGNDFTVRKETIGHQFLYFPISVMVRIWIWYIN